MVLDLGEAGAVPGSIRWARGGQLGVRFDRRFDLRHLVRHEAAGETSPTVLKPLYLESELEADSPWAAAWDKFTPDDLDGAE